MNPAKLNSARCTMQLCNSCWKPNPNWSLKFLLNHSSPQNELRQTILFTAFVAAADSRVAEGAARQTGCISLFVNRPLARLNRRNTLESGRLSRSNALAERGAL